MTKRMLPSRIFAEQDPDTNEKRWYSTQGMGDPYVSTDVVASMLAAAYRRGATWARENPDSDEYLTKASYDYADRMTSNPDT